MIFFPTGVQLQHMPDFLCLEPTGFICFFAVLVNESRVGTLGIKTDLVL